VYVDDPSMSFGTLLEHALMTFFCRFVPWQQWRPFSKIAAIDFYSSYATLDLFPVAIPISSGSRNSIRALLTIWANLVKAATFNFKMAANQIVFCSYPFRNPLRELLIVLNNLIRQNQISVFTISRSASRIEA
jgi:hypothetical protein